MTKRFPRRIWSAALVAAILSLSLGLSGALAASTLDVRDEAHLKLSKAAGSDLLEAGQATGTVPGPVKAKLIIGVSIKLTFTLYPRNGGSISGHGAAKLHSAGRYASFAGALVITGGTGRYAHISGGGQLYGAINRENDNTTVQFIGKLKLKR